MTFEERNARGHYLYIMLANILPILSRGEIDSAFCRLLIDHPERYHVIAGLVDIAGLDQSVTSTILELSDASRDDIINWKTHES